MIEAEDMSKIYKKIFWGLAKWQHSFFSKLVELNVIELFELGKKCEPFKWA